MSFSSIKKDSLTLRMPAIFQGKTVSSQTTPTPQSTSKATPSTAKNARSNSPAGRRESMGAQIMRSISPGLFLVSSIHYFFFQRLHCLNLKFLLHNDIFLLFGLCSQRTSNGSQEFHSRVKIPTTKPITLVIL